VSPFFPPSPFFSQYMLSPGSFPFSLFETSMRPFLLFMNFFRFSFLTKALSFPVPPCTRASDVLFLSTLFLKSNSRSSPFDSWMFCFSCRFFRLTLFARCTFAIGPFPGGLCCSLLQIVSFLQPPIHPPVQFPRASNRRIPPTSRPSFLHFLPW